jgi:hypothetical protein
MYYYHKSMRLPLEVFREYRKLQVYLFIAKAISTKYRAQ